MRVLIEEAGVEYRIAGDRKIRTPEDAVNAAKDIACGLSECFVALYLNKQNGMIASEVITIGILDASLVHAREVFRPAILRAAACLVLIHNHPGGDPTPSAEDVRITRQLVEAGKIIDIRVMDHIIIAMSGDGLKSLSMREAELCDFS
jgi:DNA repair protein RadC